MTDTALQLQKALRDYRTNWECLMDHERKRKADELRELAAQMQEGFDRVAALRARLPDRSE